MQHIHWETASTGNHVVKDGDNQVLCTVYQKPPGSWRIAINVDTPYLGRQTHFSDEEINELAAAKTHAEELLAIRHELKPNAKAFRDSIFTGWREQKTTKHGKPTYGRKSGPINLSVKCSARGAWYFTPYGHDVKSEAVGWFPSAEAAMAAADKRYS